MGIIRKIRKILIGYNSTDGSIDNLGGTGEIHNLSDNDGSLESTYYEETFNQHCGCFAPPGGRCSECGVISCIRCHQHCGGTENPNPLGCGKPLCREHSHYLTVAEGRTIPFCKRCYSRITRKQRRQRITGLLLAPFIEQEANNEQ